MSLGKVTLESKRDLLALNLGDPWVCVQNWASATASGCALRANGEGGFFVLFCVCVLFCFVFYREWHPVDRYGTPAQVP